MIHCLITLHVFFTTAESRSKIWLLNEFNIPSPVASGCSKAVGSLAIYSLFIFYPACVRCVRACVRVCVCVCVCVCVQYFVSTQVAGRERERGWLLFLMSFFAMGRAAVCDV